MDSVNDQRVYELVGLLYRLSNRYSELSSLTIDFGTKEKLTTAEIHSIAAIGHDEGLTITSLSNKLGITKGAVSQMIKKLETKGYITKTRHPDFWKEVMLHLTKKGKTAFRGHEKFHRRMDAGFIKEIIKYTPEQINSYTQLMKAVETQIEKYYKEME